MEQAAANALANRMTRVQRSTGVLLVLSSIALLAVSVCRAALPFGVDESLTFSTFTGTQFWLRAANNHPLNTLLMHWCSRLFGNSELSLRLPNILAHGLYLVCVLALLQRVRDPALQLLGFVLFNLNLLALEYFALARGYGLALAFEMLSLYLFVRACEQVGQRPFARDLYLAVAAGALAAFSNYAWANYYLPLVLICCGLLLTDGSLRRISPKQIGTALALAAGGGLVLAYIVGKLFQLKRAGELYWGGYDGFLTDTIHSLVRCSLYSRLDTSGAVRVISAILIGLFVLLMALAIYQLWYSKKATVFGLLVLLLTGAVALPLVEHRLFNTLFPIERAALYYLPLCATALVYAVRLIRGTATESSRGMLTSVLAAAMAIPVGGYFCRGITERSSCAWLVDIHNREVLDLIQRDRAARSLTGPVKLRTHWTMEPSFNFYRTTRNYTWLTQVIRKPIPDPDYIYTFDENLGMAATVKLAAYPDIQTVLLRVVHGDQH